MGSGLDYLLRKVAQDLGGLRMCVCIYGEVGEQLHLKQRRRGISLVTTELFLSWPHQVQNSEILIPPASS